MSEEVKAVEEQAKDNSAERNFANLRKKAEMLEQERESFRVRLEQLERERDESLRKSKSVVDEDEDDEPYVTPKKLKREQSRYGEEFEKRVEQKVEQKFHQRFEEERRSQYLRENPDFNDVLSEDNVKDLIESHPKVAESILSMPDTFERKRLVYETVKSFKKVKEASRPAVQDKIDSNRRSPYYRPSNVSTAPYGGDIDPKAAYQQMQDLKARLRLG